MISDTKDNTKQLFTMNNLKLKSCCIIEFEIKYYVYYKYVFKN